jgi:sirohydrochlorin cobaltochelatase
MSLGQKRQVIVLAMHGAVPLDFPRQELLAYFELSFKAAHLSSSLSPEEKERLLQLENKIKRWPRTEANDPFYAGSEKLRRALENLSGQEVILGFNEFCSPSVEEALEIACSRQPERVLVLTPMLTQGGEHAARDIPAAIHRVQVNHPEIKIVYAWPLEPEEVAKFLLEVSQKKITSGTTEG